MFSAPNWCSGIMPDSKLRFFAKWQVQFQLWDFFLLLHKSLFSYWETNGIVLIQQFLFKTIAISAKMRNLRKIMISLYSHSLDMQCALTHRVLDVQHFCVHSLDVQHRGAHSLDVKHICVHSLDVQHTTSNTSTCFRTYCAQPLRSGCATSLCFLTECATSIFVLTL